MRFDANARDDRLSAELWQRAMVVVELPRPGRYGELRIVREQATTVSLFGRRYSASPPFESTSLHDGAVLWMSDTPQERLMMLQGTRGMSGHVLVAGGGLGLYVQFLRRYCPIERVTVVEQHPVMAALLRHMFVHDPRVSVVEAAFESFIFASSAACFDCCYIDIHPTIDPLWLPNLNWLRDQCAAIVRGPLRIWGYAWMGDLLVEGLLREYIPLLRAGRNYNTALGRQLELMLPGRWREWSDPQLAAWLATWSQRVAWPAAWSEWASPRAAA